MRGIITLLLMFLGGCQSLPGSDAWTRAQPPSSVWSLWERYQQCRTTTDLDQLRVAIDDLDQAMITGVTPPAWIVAFGVQGARHPLRTSVDPEALGAACTIRAAMVFQTTGRFDEARAFYHRVLTRYGALESAYYREQAITALQRLDAQILARRRETTTR